MRGLIFREANREEGGRRLKANRIHASDLGNGRNAGLFIEGRVRQNRKK